MQLVVGAIIEGKVTGITKFGAFVEISEGKVGLVHISEVSREFVKEVRDYLTEGQMVKVKILNVSDGGKIGLSIKQATVDEEKPKRTVNKLNGNWNASGGKSQFHEHNQCVGKLDDMIARFKKDSEENQYYLKRSNDAKHGGSSRRGNQTK